MVLGGNSNGRLGLNDFANKSSPTQVGAQSNWNKLAGGDSHGLVTNRG